MVSEERGGIKTVDEYLDAPLDFSDLADRRESFLKYKTTIRFNGPNVVYMLMMVNTHNRPLYDISITIEAPDFLLPIRKGMTVDTLMPENPEVFKFELRPTRVCGEFEISSQISFINPKTDHRKDIDVEPVKGAVEPPMIYAKEIDQVAWLETVKRLQSVTERILIPRPGQEVLPTLTQTLRHVNIYTLEPSMAASPIGIKAKARFYCESASNRYAILADIASEGAKTKLKLTTFAENKALLIGFHHAVLDELDLAIGLKQFIVDPVIRKNIKLFKKKHTRLIEAPQFQQPSGEQPAQPAPHQPHPQEGFSPGAHAQPQQQFPPPQQPPQAHPQQPQQQYPPQQPQYPPQQPPPQEPYPQQQPQQPYPPQQVPPQQPPQQMPPQQQPPQQQPPQAPPQQMPPQDPYPQQPPQQQYPPQQPPPQEMPPQEPPTPQAPPQEEHHPEAAAQPAPPEAPAAPDESIISCFQCGQQMALEIASRPVIIECPYCGAKGVLE